MLEDEWEAHDAPICSIGWAHPEFGQMLVSGSMDRTTKVWEKLPSFLIEEATESGPRTKAWKMVCSLGDAKGAVRSVEFAPAMWGLKLVGVHWTDCINLTCTFFTGIIINRQHSPNI
jgi:nucleoporin SEH1